MLSEIDPSVGRERVRRSVTTGFTIIESIIVLAVLGVLFSLIRSGPPTQSAPLFGNDLEAFLATKR